MTEQTTNWDTLPLTLSAKEVGKILGISKNVTYDLMHRKDFPAIRVTERKLIVPRDNLKDWLDRQAAGEYIGA